MNRLIFSCCDAEPKFLITYNVAGKEKTYKVCNACATLEYFNKFIIKKELVKLSLQEV